MVANDTHHSDSYNVVTSLKDGVWAVDTIDKLPEGIQPQISVEELLLCEDIIRADERVLKLAKDVGMYLSCSLCKGLSLTVTSLLGVEPHQLFADGWALGE